MSRYGLRLSAPGVALAVTLGLLLVAFLVLVPFEAAGPQLGQLADDLGELLAAVAASVSCGWRARRSPVRVARPWWFLTAGTGSWALGQSAWSYFELVLHQPVLFPSVADAGFLPFPVLSAVGLLLWPSAPLGGITRWRALLDGVLVAGALLILSWVTTLGSVVDAGGETTLSYAISLSYPLADLVLLTLAVVVVAHARAARSGLTLVLAGLVCLCVADSGFAYLTAAGIYALNSTVDLGWFGGFLLIAAAAYLATAPGGEDPDGEDPVAPRVQLESAPRMMLPYLPAGVALVVASTTGFAGHHDPVVAAAAIGVVMALLVRQLLAVLDNRGLVRQVLAAQEELRHQAFHDPLTGLANRALLNDRLRHGLALHQRDLRRVSVLYCDLDGFKTVNDTHGHEAGDRVLQCAARRLNAVTRAGDTTARVGGDEFAILLLDGGNPQELAARILGAFAEPVAIGNDEVGLATSIGIAELTPDQATPSADALLQRADRAMYRAKRSGKGTVVTWTDQLFPASPPPASQAAADTAATADMATP